MAQEQTPEHPQITLLDGKTVATPNLSVAAGAVSGTDIPAGTTLDDLQLIQLTAAPVLPPLEKPAIIVDLVGGGSIGAKQVTLADDQCIITWAGGDPLKVSIDALRAIRLQPTIDSEEFNKSLAAPAADVDRLFVKVEGKIDSLTGLMSKLTETEISLEIDGQVRNLPRDRVLGVVISQAAPETRLPRCTFHLRDGSVLGGDLISLQGNKAQVQVGGNSQIALPWDTVQRVVVRSSRVLFLSDLKPTAVKQQAFVTLARPWQKDRSVTGKPLTLGTRVFDKGIGVQSHNELTFDVPDDFDSLNATIGIDADAAGKGDCLIEVMVDGQKLLSERVRGNEPPRDIQVPLKNARASSLAGTRQITLVVLPGADLDLADHADWALVRLLKNKK
ncbi:NPCBM/NEW2 domain-containing protein [Anatilimnocola floriformis]|uniref:NPCBM/NEW2 domain-containing protein n=1 Tax=Anatilimnocola floriformis TaxID=2948575 RepID=UPI0020C3C4E3|nr:NPCBM/NEW2 domain-containing protein [Anatilimnocola floriformis]